MPYKPVIFINIIIKAVEWKKNIANCLNMLDINTRYIVFHHV